MSFVLTSKSQVTIPKPVREALGIGPGSAVDFQLTKDGQVMLVPTEGRRRAPSRFANLRGTASIKMTTDEIMALTRGEE
jgi:AbrB family looped-hinge helix DNA binding protein